MNEFLPEIAQKKELTQREFSALGGIARGQKLTQAQLQVIGKKGGRPKKKLSKKSKG